MSATFCDANDCTKPAYHGFPLTPEERLMPWKAAGGSPGPLRRRCGAHKLEGMVSMQHRIFLGFAVNNHVVAAAAGVHRIEV